LAPFPILARDSSVQHQTSTVIGGESIGESVIDAADPVIFVMFAKVRIGNE
jgi:hypothetical protein